MNKFNSDKFNKFIRQIREDYPALLSLNTVELLEVYSTLQTNTVKEFVTFTVSAKKTAEELTKRFPDVEAFVSFNESIEVFFDRNNIWRYKKVIKFFDSFGWFPAYFATKDTKMILRTFHSKFTDEKFQEAILRTNKNDTTITLLNFEAKYNEREAPESFYYHISPDIYSDKIDRIGLTPRSKGKLSSHPDRVYLLNPVEEYDIEAVANRLYQSMTPQEKEKSKRLYVYKVYPSKMKDPKFYTDPNFNMANGAVWTNDNIPPSAMEKEYFFELQ